MANSKESVVVILDVGTGAEQLTKKAAEYTLELIKHKIYYHNVDLLSILLLRTEETENNGNSEEPTQYLHISKVLPGSQVATWYMAKEFKRSLQKKKCKSGDWVDALIVAIGIITEDTILHKARFSKIVLFHNFDSTPSSLDDIIIAKLNEMDLKLLVVSSNIHYVPDSDGNLRPQFKDYSGKSAPQARNEKLAMQLLSAYPHTTLCNFKDALPLILNSTKWPSCWNTVLSIGSQIVIHISGVLAIKEEKTLPLFQKQAKGANQSIVRGKKLYSGVDELTDIMQQELLTGFMLGNTPVTYDPSLGQAVRADTKRGIHFIGFVQVDKIPQEHFAGESTYLVIPQKGKQVSAKMMDSLVAVMLESKVCILAWKVYNNGHKPKLSILLPNLDNPMAALSMIELSYHSQHRFWDFPKLTTKKNQASPDQLAAVDELMAAMDLSHPSDTSEDKAPRESMHKDHLPFEHLPDVRRQHLLDFLAKTILGETRSENLIKVPDFLQPQATLAAKNIKALFKLEHNEAPTKEKLRKHLNEAAGQDVEICGDTISSTSVPTDFNLTHVGTVTPAEDFTALISYVINRMPNGAERAAKFHQYACQMRSVISDLLFKSMTKQNEKIAKALITYRKLSIAADSLYDYNDWMREIRIKVIERKMWDFWDDVIVKQKLGLCIDSDKKLEEEFYDISKEIAAASNADTIMEDDESVEDLFFNM